jgi:hypothetical protein
MPSSFVNDPKHWRERAAEMRRLADEDLDTIACERAEAALAS